MTYFPNLLTRTPRQLLDGVQVRTYWGDQMLVSVVDLDPGATIPPHSHPHEQVGIMVSGEMELTVGGETRTLQPGDLYIVPGGTEHGVRNGDKASRAFEAFSPVREEYKFPD